MLLRASGEMAGKQLDLRAVTDGSANAEDSGVAHATELVAFAEAVVGTDDAALSAARDRLVTAVGAEALVDAAAVASNFERMVRVADSTGIPLDTPLAALTTDIREELSIDSFGSAANTPELGQVGRALGAAARTVLFGAVRLMGARKARRERRSEA